MEQKQKPSLTSRTNTGTHWNLNSKSKITKRNRRSEASIHRYNKSLPKPAQWSKHNTASTMESKQRRRFEIGNWWRKLRQWFKKFSQTRRRSPRFGDPKMRGERVPFTTWLWNSKKQIRERERERKRKGRKSF